MGVQVIHLICIHARIAQGRQHGAARAIHIGRGNVTSVGTHAIAEQFSINFGATGFGMLVFFQHKHACTFAQDKTITVFVPRAGSGLGIVVARRQGTHGGKTTHAKW